MTSSGLLRRFFDGLLPKMGLSLSADQTGTSAASGTTGAPTSSNGASSSHLFWQLPPTAQRTPLVEASVDIQVLDLPQRPALFFWALQASFQKGGRTAGAGHLGLQFYPEHPHNGALNWGGYYGPDSSQSGELAGSPLRLPSTPGNPNTGDYQWTGRRAYRYRIFQSPEQGWRGSITDLETGEETVIRDLWCEGDRLSDLMVWTESFADCDDPATTVRWSNFCALTNEGERVSAAALRVNYQSIGNGGCVTSNCLKDPRPDGTTSVLQQTGVHRSTPQDSIVDLSSAEPISRGKR